MKKKKKLQIHKKLIYNVFAFVGEYYKLNYGKKVPEIS